MARATYRQIVADVQRKPGLENLSLGEIIDAVATAAKDVGNQPWPWNYAEYTVPVPAAITVGTVNVVDGTPTVGLVGGAWTVPVTQPQGWRFRLGNSNLDYIVSSFLNNTT